MERTRVVVEPLLDEELLDVAPEELLDVAPDELDEVAPPDVDEDDESGFCLPASRSSPLGVVSSCFRSSNDGKRHPASMAAPPKAGERRAMRTS